ncbi:MAG: 50S ribosomal protein L32 [Candidatus Sumerlaeota bacterium]|nr:50S ribosomal protein L32 [Candidatus Sumerlaeota bacterium]
MTVPRRRHSNLRRDKARTHKKLAVMKSVACPKCGEPKLPHRICPACGAYKEKKYKVQVIE